MMIHYWLDTESHRWIVSVEDDASTTLHVVDTRAQAVRLAHHEARVRHLRVQEG